jgi:hypothetical protein
MPHYQRKIPPKLFDWIRELRREGLSTSKINERLRAEHNIQVHSRTVTRLLNTFADEDRKIRNSILAQKLTETIGDDLAQLRELQSRLYERTKNEKSQHFHKDVKALTDLLRISLSLEAKDDARDVDLDKQEAIEWLSAANGKTLTPPQVEGDTSDPPSDPPSDPSLN